MARAVDCFLVRMSNKLKSLVQNSSFVDKFLVWYRFNPDKKGTPLYMLVDDLLNGDDNFNVLLTLVRWLHNVGAKYFVYNIGH